ncbi:hypothetical protein A1D22_03480 [Pasteurellaceae bacterium LFhippo2]|nr:hypothetical protein [Pasteurellaceae bacterium LFhippo2]
MTKTKILGIGGAGLNIVKYIKSQAIDNVSYLLLGTDQALLQRFSDQFQTIVMGDGNGTQGDPNYVVDTIAKESEKLTAIFENTERLFLFASLGGGTGTGAAPEIAKLAKAQGIKVFAGVTTPFSFEGRKRNLYADISLKDLEQNCDGILVLSNQKLLKEPSADEFNKLNQQFYEFVLETIQLSIR